MKNYSDEKLLKLCVKFGARALKWRGRFLGLLPEANRRRIFEKKGFNSIFEFAYRLAGLSEEQVRLVLRLDLKFEDKPMLKGLLAGGEVSVSKLARVASVATAENEQEWAEVVNSLPRGALETLVRDQRVIDERAGDGWGAANGGFGSRAGLCAGAVNLVASGLGEPLFECKSVPGHGLNFEISEELASELNELHRQGHDVNGMILGLLKKRRAEITQRKEELGEEAIARAKAKRDEQRAKGDAGLMSGARGEGLREGAENEFGSWGQGARRGLKKRKSTYVSVKIKTVLHEEYGTKCSIPTCNKPAEEDHYSQRFSIAGLHDPRYMAPMCKEHHEIAHLVDGKYREKRKG